ncbi:unnamed protein product [Linum tenue]|uniref:Tropinone reductase-like 3 n=1 Tax=Linum tenue TaxID=586396 RepID=A0AAV0JPE1_9ROSI|nr:unnamed protein product [Linum tenue]
MSKIGRRFEGKVAIVTASTQGIGFAIAQRLGLEGASIVISSRKQQNVDEAVEKLRAQGIQNVIGVVCHVSNAQQRKNLIEKTVEDAAPHMPKGSSVVLVSSITGYHPPSSMAMYGVTKTALLGLTKALAAEMAPDIRVNCIAPGFVPTHFASFITENDEMRKELEAQTLLNRLGTTEDMGAAVAFLASDDASYITGETLVVAGGMPSRL